MLYAASARWTQLGVDMDLQLMMTALNALLAKQKLLEAVKKSYAPGVHPVLPQPGVPTTTLDVAGGKPANGVVAAAATAAQLQLCHSAKLLLIAGEH